MHKELTFVPLVCMYLSVVPYSDDTSSIDESEPGGAPTPQISILSWSDSSKKDQKDDHSPFEVKSLKRRGQARRNSADATPLPKQGEDGFCRCQWSIVRKQLRLSHDFKVSHETLQQV